MDTIHHAQALCPERSLSAILADLGLPKTTYYHWQARAAAGQLTDDVVTPPRTALPPTPEEVQVVTTYAQGHPLLGYKRLTFALMAENKAFLRPWMVHDTRSVDDAHLLGRRAPLPDLLTRPPAEARRILKRLEFHYTPKHGSWLNMAELELGVFSRECWDRRIGDPDTLAREIRSLEEERNAAHATVQWRFTTQHTRTKLHRLYPSLSA